MIYVITHKKFDDSFLDRKHYKILHVGLNKDCKEEYLRDDTGDSISSKNAHYCELTGLYWIWKNIKADPDEVTGLVHYRRFFTTKEEDFQYAYFLKMPKVLTWDRINDLVKNNTVILPACTSTLDTVYRTYGRMHYAEDIKLAGRGIKKLRPDYLDAYKKVMNSHKASYGNMIICKRKILDEYCSWLFPILAYVDKRIDYSKYESDYQRRVIGFLAERLLDVWAENCPYKVKRYPVFNTEEPRKNIFSLSLFRLQSLVTLLQGKSLRS